MVPARAGVALPPAYPLQGACLGWQRPAPGMGSVGPPGAVSRNDLAGGPVLVVPQRVADRLTKRSGDDQFPKPAHEQVEAGVEARLGYESGPFHGPAQFLDLSIRGASGF